MPSPTAGAAGSKAATSRREAVERVWALTMATRRIVVNGAGPVRAQACAPTVSASCRAALGGCARGRRAANCELFGRGNAASLTFGLTPGTARDRVEMLDTSGRRTL